MEKSAARRFVDLFERELVLHREMLEIVGGREPADDGAGSARPELGLADSLSLAARVRGAHASAFADVEHGGGIFEVFESLPADEAARAAELRRQFERVLAALSSRRRVRAPGASPS